VPCTCPEPIYMSIVTDVHNDDGSLAVAPNVNSVEVHLNTAHSNLWSIYQIFNSGNPLMPAVEIRGFAGQSGPYTLCRRSTGTVCFQVVPGPTEAQANLEMYATSGGPAFAVSSAGDMSLSDTVSGNFVAFDVTSTGTRFFATGVFAIDGGDLRIQARTVMRENGAPGEPHPTQGVVDICQGVSSGETVFTVREDAAVGTAVFFQVWGGFAETPDSQVLLNAPVFGAKVSMAIFKPQASDGLRIVADHAGASTFPMLSVCAASGAAQLGMREDGCLFTQAALTGGPMTAIVHRWPIYDAFGNLLGYLPIIS
jgi:hypothetical protein